MFSAAKTDGIREEPNEVTRKKCENHPDIVPCWDPTDPANPVLDSNFRDSEEKCPGSRKPNCDHLLELQEVLYRFLKPTYNALDKDARERLCKDWIDGKNEKKAFDLLNSEKNLRGLDAASNSAKELIYLLPEKNIYTRLAKIQDYMLENAIDYFKQYGTVRNEVADEFLQMVKDLVTKEYAAAAAADPESIESRIKTTLDLSVASFEEYMTDGLGSTDKSVEVRRA
ncbi:hypothetical protein HK104_003412 [Borealophlyctis nickersoniae]|nr:hypothetical protein HK104_003412 [Borealophlyctis nickersoniae]